MSDIPASWIRPEWPGLPDNVVALVSTREGGVSEGCWASFNPAAHVEDNPGHVQQNRALLNQRMQSLLPEAAPLVFVDQVHGVNVVKAGTQAQADAVYSDQANTLCAVMTADCLPVLFASADGKEVAAAHAGWRGLAAGVLEQTIKQFKSQELTAWMGPAIGPQAFEVGEDVRQVFLQGCETQQAEVAVSQAFAPGKPGHYFCNIYQLARLRLAACGIERVYGGDFCTVSEPHFFSYRRDGVCGRMVSLIGFQL